VIITLLVENFFFPIPRYIRQEKFEAIVSLPGINQVLSTFLKFYSFQNRNWLIFLNHFLRSSTFLFYFLIKRFI